MKVLQTVAGVIHPASSH